MRTALLILGILAFPYCYAHAQTGPADEAEIRRAIDEAGRAFVARESEPLERIFRDDYVNIRSKPVFNAKSHLMAMVKADAAAVRAGRGVDLETLSYDTDDIAVRLYADIAIVTSSKKNHWRFGTEKCLTQYRATELWIKQPHWKIAAAHFTQFQCENPPKNSLHPAVAASGFLDAPRLSAAKQTVSDIQALIAQAKMEPASDYFTDEFASTDTNGVVGNNNADLLAGFRAGLKDDEFFMEFGDAVLYIFRTRPRIGKPSSGGVRQYSAIFLKNDGRWKIAASHVSRPAD